MLQYFGKKIKTKSQNVLWANFYVCSTYMGKIGRGNDLRQDHSILLFVAKTQEWKSK